MSERPPTSGAPSRFPIPSFPQRDGPGRTFPLGSSPGGGEAKSYNSKHGSFGTSPQFNSLLGSSPPNGLGSAARSSDKIAPAAAAKKMWKRICFDPTLDPESFMVGNMQHAVCTMLGAMAHAAMRGGLNPTSGPIFTCCIGGIH